VEIPGLHGVCVNGNWIPTSGGGLLPGPVAAPVAELAEDRSTSWSAWSA
jgi:hypothetical protein